MAKRKAKTEASPDNEAAPVIKNENSYEIRRGVGVPPNWRLGQTQYPFVTLDLNDGFSFPTEKARSVAAAARSYGKRTGTKFAVRRDPDKPGNHLCVRVD